MRDENFEVDYEKGEGNTFSLQSYRSNSVGPEKASAAPERQVLDVDSNPSEFYDMVDSLNGSIKYDALINSDGETDTSEMDTQIMDALPWE